MGWTEQTLTRNTPLLARGVPTAYLFARQGTRHVVTLGQGDHPAAKGSLDEWYDHRDLDWAEHSLRIGIDAPLAQSRPRGYAHEAERTQHVLYMAAGGAFGHVHELWWGDDDWHHHDLHDASGAPLASGLPHGYAYDGQPSSQHVVFVSTGGAVVELSHAGSGWHWSDLTAATGAPRPLGDPWGYPFVNEGTRHVVYRDADHGITELWTFGDVWHGGSITVSLGAPEPAGEPVGYAFTSHGTQHVAYVGADQHVHELSWGVGPLRHDDLTALTGAIGPRSTVLAAYPFDPGVGVPVPTRHVLYVGFDQHLHELWWDATWHHEDLSVVLGLPLLDDAPAGFADPAGSSQHVFAVDVDGHLHALTWRP